MTTYAAVIISFIGALIGLAGNSWNGSKKGFIKLTFKGWSALFTIVAGFILSLYSIYINQEKADWAAQQRNAIADIGRRELNYALRHVAEPFIDILWESGRLDFLKGLHHDDYEREAFQYLASDQARKFFDDDVDLEAKPKDDILGRDYDTYADAIEHGASVVPSELDRIFTRYANYLSIEEVLALRSITTDYYLIELRNVGMELDNLGETELFSLNSGYLNFFSLMSVLRSVDSTR